MSHGKRRSLEQLWSSFAYQKSPRGVLKKAALFALAPIGYLYLVIASIKNFAYDKKILSSKPKASVPVISIGNITVGGTGKTPLTILLAKKLARTGRGAIVTRGYRSKAETAKNPLILTHDNQHLYPPEMSGDEPRLIASQSDAFVIINKRKEKSLLVADSLNVNWVILDDGMQRRSIPRDLEIITLGSQFLGNQLGFPAGPLREPLDGLKRADLIIITKSPKAPLSEEQKSLIRRYSGAPLIEAEWSISALSNDHEKLPLKANETISAFCGIGNPGLFFETLEKQGFNIKDKVILDDHRPMSEQELIAFCDQAASQGVNKVICTEKDFVKISRERRLKLPLFYTEAELTITSGSETLERRLSALFSSEASMALSQ